MKESEIRPPLRSRRARSSVQDLLEALGVHRQLRHRTRHPDGVVDGGRNRSPHPGDAALPCPFDAERIERAGVLLAQDDLDLGSLTHRWHEVIRKGGGQRIAALIISEL